MAWSTITDVNDGQTFGGTNYQQVQDAIAQIRTALGPDEVLEFPVTLASPTPTAAASFTLMSSIPQTYKHLMIVGMVTHNNASTAGALRMLGVQFNNDAGANMNYAVHELSGTGSATNTNSSGGAVQVARIGRIGTNRTGFQVLIPNYTIATGARHCTSDGAAATNATPGASWSKFQSQFVWGVASAITQIDLHVISGGGDLFQASGNVSLIGIP